MSHDLHLAFTWNSHRLYFVHTELLLVHILTEKRHSRTIVFARTPDAVCSLALMLQYLGIRAIPITGHMKESQRLLASRLFKAGQRNVLVCTDVVIRDLDIPRVDNIINFDIPSNPKDYIHRIRRMAADRYGVAISLVNQNEPEWYLNIEKLIENKRRQERKDDEQDIEKQSLVRNGKSKKIGKNKRDGFSSNSAKF